MKKHGRKNDGKERSIHMSCKREKWEKMFLMLVVFSLFTCFGIHAKAATSEIVVSDGDYQSVTAYVGDTGVIKPKTDDLEITSFYYDLDEYEDDPVLEISQDGSYRVVGLGTEIVYIDGYDTDGWEVFSAEIRFTVTVNMDQVTIRQSSITAYMIPEYDGEGTAYYDGTTAALDLVSTETLPSGTSVSVKSSNSNFDHYHRGKGIHCESQAGPGGNFQNLAFAWKEQDEQVENHRLQRPHNLEIKK
jgi:hypothetical protein